MEPAKEQLLLVITIWGRILGVVSTVGSCFDSGKSIDANDCQIGASNAN